MENNTNPLNWKDKKILNELDINARQSASEIGKKTRISKQVVIYRINNMIKEGLIKEFITFLDIKKLGYTFYDIFFKLKYSSETEEKRIINAIKNIPEVGWFISCRGEWNMAVCVLAKDPLNFNKILEKILRIFEDKLIDYNFFIVIEASQFPYKKILNISPQKNNLNKKAHLGENLELKITKDDYKILKELTKDARINLVSLVDKLNISLDRVRYSIKKLENSGVIQAYKPLLNINKLGYLWHVILIQFNYCPEKRKEEFIHFLESLPQTFYLVKGVGNWSLMFELHTDNIEEMEKTRNLIVSKFEDVIREEKVLQILNEHKCIFLPTEITA
jgi:DNA-binding Lrp family transcriptional regulator